MVQITPNNVNTKLSILVRYFQTQLLKGLNKNRSLRKKFISDILDTDLLMSVILSSLSYCLVAYTVIR